MKKVFLKTFGCQMNMRDSEFVKGILIEDGFEMADSLDEADVALFNSCSVRKHAEDRLFSNIASLNELKKKRPSLVIGLIGCTAQNYKANALERLPILDIVCGPGNEGDLPEIIKDILKNRCAIIAADKIDAPRPELFPGYRDEAFKAYVSIGEGCSNYCSYCIVPYVRGKERSRDFKNIIKEIKDLAARGVKEITLLGQNVNSYKSKGGLNGFVGLLEEINEIDGIERIRFMTSHPKDATSDLFKAMQDLDKVCEHLHLPLQSGSDRISKLMNRGYTAEKYLKLIQDYKHLVPDGSLTTDIIVGFPSESEKDFEDTLNLMKEIGFDGSFIFKYSPRPPAKSAKLKDDVRKEAKEERLKKLLELQANLSKMRNEPMKGRDVEVLVDGRNKKNYSLLTGRTRTNKIVIFDGDKGLIREDRGLVGGKVFVRIESVTPYTLKGRAV